MRRALLACLLVGVCVPAAASTSAAQPAPAGLVKPSTTIDDPYLRTEIAQMMGRRTQQVAATVDVEVLHTLHPRRWAKEVAVEGHRDGDVLEGQGGLGAPAGPDRVL